MKFYQRIRTQLTFGFLVVTFIPTVLIGFYAMQTAVETVRERELNNQATIVKSLKQEIETFLSITQKDLVFLSQSQPLKQYLALRTTKGLKLSALESKRQIIEQEFLAFAQNRDIYYQIRYLDETGQEVVRVDTIEGQSQIIALEQLQNKANRYYFTETMLLSARNIFVSPLDLNVEHGKIQVPYKPVIRYAMPLSYSDGRKAGIVITNVDANKFLQKLGNAILVDQEGYYLAHPDPDKLWGNLQDLKTGQNLVRNYPHLATEILENMKGNKVTDQLILSFHRVLVPGLGHWTLIIQRSLDDVTQQIVSFQITFSFILLAAIVVSLIISYFINKMITRPIENLIRLVRRVRTGERNIHIDIERRDELGALNEGFNAMIKAIKASEEELQRAQKEAQAANLAKSRFLANMSHELRTPLNAIIGYGEMLQEEIAELGEVELSNDIQKIHMAGKYLLSTINDILDVSKIEAGKMELYTETFYLPNMINDVVHTIEPLLAKNGDTLEVHYGDQLGEMHTDLTKVRHILLNLLSNLSKFNEQNCTIFLNASRQQQENEEKDWIVFHISDNGSGMDMEQKQEIIQMFSQTGMFHTRMYGGSGDLGLAVTHHFIEMMGGLIDFDSELGDGSSFIVHLPANIEFEQHAQVTLATPEAVLEEGGIVLVIDDDLEVRTVLQKYLSKLGYQVEIAESGEEGLRLAKKVLPDVITLDVMMPKMDGWEVLSHLKADAELANIPVIILSMIEDKSVGYSLGASDYLIKPITREQLSRVLQKYHFSHSDSARLVMVIDDDAVNRDIIARMMRRAGWRVTKIDDGRVALNYIQKKQPDLILLDLQMPEMDGFEFIHRLHQLYNSSIPVIVLTAKEITLEDRLRLDKNAASILQKGSYSREELLAEVNKLFSQETSETD